MVTHLYCIDSYLHAALALQQKQQHQRIVSIIACSKASPSAEHHAQVRIISLDPEDTMKVLGVQAVQSTPESLLLLDSPLVGASGTEEGRGVGALFLHIGQHLSLLTYPV